jgi:hypothetical protein
LHLRQLIPEASMLFLIGHAHSHQHITIRDINDCYQLFKNYPSMDFLWVIEKVKANNLEHICGDIMAWVSWLYPEINPGGLNFSGRRHNQLWPQCYKMSYVLKQWWNYGRTQGAALKEVFVLGWGNAVALFLAPFLTGVTNSFIESGLGRLVKLRNKQVEFFYLVNLGLLLDSEEQNCKISPNVDDVFGFNGAKAKWDSDLNGARIYLQHGEMLMTDGGSFLVSPNLLVEEKLMEESIDFLQIIDEETREP